MTSILSAYVIHRCFILNTFCETNDEYINRHCIKAVQKCDKEFLLGLERKTVSKNKAGRKAIRNNCSQYFG